MTQEDQRAWYLEHRQSLETASTEQVARFETAVLTAAGAGVGGIFYLIAQPGAFDRFNSFWAISSAGLFAVSFFSVLLSNLTSHSDMQRELGKFDAAYISGQFESIGKNRWGMATLILNWLSPFLLLLGGLATFLLLHSMSA